MRGLCRATPARSANLKLYKREKCVSAHVVILRYMKEKCISADVVVQRYIKEKCVSAHASRGSLKINESETRRRIGNLEL